MNANIFRHEFRARWGSILAWSIALTAMILIFFAFFTAFADQASLMQDLMSKFPPQLLAAFGMTGMDMSSVLGYFTIIYLFIQVCLAIQAGNYGFGLVSIEESELTADFLLTRPVSRAQIFVSKLLAALASMAVAHLVVWAVTLAAFELFRGGREYDLRVLVLLLLGLIVFQLFFLSVGLVISLLVKRVRSVTPYSLGLGFGMYVLSAFSGIQGESALEYLTPFKHFNPNHIVANGTLDSPLVFLSAGVIVLSLTVSYLLYRRRDIPAAV